MANDSRRRRRILVVDDDASYREAIAEGLTKEGFSVAVASDGRRALEQFTDSNFDAVILDLRLPDMPGTAVCQKIRQTSEVPILMLSASAEEIDVVLSFELGADDYVNKPLRMRELVARIEAAFRHQSQASSFDTSAHPREDLKIGRLSISFDARTVELKGKSVGLSRREFDLLAELAKRPGRVSTREELMAAVWHSESSDDRTIDTHIYRLRSKIERDADHPELVVTVRGVGYLLNDKVTAK